jgi:putative heme iron utilization protein
LRFSADARPLADAEPEILEHMNRDHAEAIELYANRIIGRQGAGWRMTGIDPEGIDLRRSMEAGGETARLDFEAPVLTPAAARLALAGLAQRARAIPGG